MQKFIYNIIFLILGVKLDHNMNNTNPGEISQYCLKRNKSLSELIDQSCKCSYCVQEFSCPYRVPLSEKDNYHRRLSEPISDHLNYLLRYLAARPNSFSLETRVYLNEVSYELHTYSKLGYDIEEFNKKYKKILLRRDNNIVSRIPRLSR